MNATANNVPVSLAMEESLLVWLVVDSVTLVLVGIIIHVNKALKAQNQGAEDLCKRFKAFVHTFLTQPAQTLVIGLLANHLFEVDLLTAHPFRILILKFRKAEVARHNALCEAGHQRPQCQCG